MHTRLKWLSLFDIGSNTNVLDSWTVSITKGIFHFNFRKFSVRTTLPRDTKRFPFNQNFEIFETRTNGMEISWKKKGNPKIVEFPKSWPFTEPKISEVQLGMRIKRKNISRKFQNSGYTSMGWVNFLSACSFGCDHSELDTPRQDDCYAYLKMDHFFG